MRVSSGIGGFLVVLALAAGVTSASWAHTSTAPLLTAAKAPIAAASYNGVETGDPAPQRMIPRPRPDPSPTPPPAAIPTKAPAAPAATLPAPAPAPSIRSTQQALINRDRAAHGLAPLTWSSCLYTVASSNAARMAAQGYISHTNGPTRDLGCGVGRQAGENVGWWSGGMDDAQLNTMFMNSADHRANILGPYRYVATCWVVAANGYGYVAVEFS